MSAPRKQIMAALLAKLGTAYAFTVTGRRNRDPNNIVGAGQSALLLLKHHEHQTAKSPNMPNVRTLHLKAVVYIDVSNDDAAIPDDLISDIMDGIDAAMKPDGPDGRCTLGGLVWSAKIDGEITNAPGDVTGKGLAIIPIDIVLP